MAGLPAFAAAFHEYPELTPIKKLFTKRNRYVNFSPPNIRSSNNEYLTERPNSLELNNKLKTQQQEQEIQNNHKK